MFSFSTSLVASSDLYRASSRVPGGRGKSVVWAVWGPGEYEKRFSIGKPLSWGVLQWKWPGYLSSHFRVDNAALGLAFLPLKLSLWVMRFYQIRECLTADRHRRVPNNLVALGIRGGGEAPLGRGCREPAKGYSTMGIILFLVKGLLDLLGLVPIKNNKKNKFNFFFCIQTTDRMRSGNKWIRY